MLLTATTLFAVVVRAIDGRVKCSVREHDRHLFGDITDTSLHCQVDVSDPVRAKENPISPIRSTRPDGEPFAKEGLTDRPRPTLELNVGLRRANLSHDVAFIIRRLGR